MTDLKNNLRDRLAALTANNRMGSKDSFLKKLAYRAYAYEDIEDPSYSPVKDFNMFERILYGRVDLSFNALEPSLQHLVPIPQNEEHFTFAFVASAYSEFEKEMKTAVTNGKIRNAPFLENITVKGAFVPSRPSHAAILNSLGASFIHFYSQTRRLKEIRNFKDFITKFQDFVYEYAHNTPLSSPSFILSNYCSLSNSGLAIEIEKGDFSDDSEKMKFITSPYFEYYLACASRFGFYVDKNYPFRLVANLSSPAMKKFILANRHATSDLRTVFTTNYEKVHTSDLEIFKSLSYRLYGHITSSRPDIFDSFEEDGKLFTQVLQREFILPAEVEEKYPDEFWLEFYVRLRNIEASLDFPDQALARIVNNSIDLKNLVDKSYAMDYINKVFIDIPAQEGSLNDHKNRQYFKDIDDRPFSDYKEYLAKTAKQKR